MPRHHDSNFEPRVRFNWGFHDAAQCVEQGWDKTGQCFAGQLGKCVTPEQVIEFHHDSFYAHGWAAGFRAKKAGTYINNSERAWVEFQAARSAA